MNEELADAATRSTEDRRWTITTCVIHIIATLLFTVFFLFSVPAFEKIFRDFDAELPGATMLTLDLSSRVTRLWYVIPQVLVIEFVALAYCRRAERTTAVWLSRLYLAAVLGGIAFAAITLFLPLVSLMQKLS